MIVEPVSLNIQTRRDVNNNQLPKEQSHLDGPAGTKAHDEQTHRGVASTFTKLLVEAFFFLLQREALVVHEQAVGAYAMPVSNGGLIGDKKNAGHLASSLSVFQLSKELQNS